MCPLFGSSTVQTLRIVRCITGVHYWGVSIKLGSTVLYLSITTGNRTYVGYMYTEVTYNNAVVRVFVKILQDAVYEKKQLSLPLGRSHLHTLSRNRIGSDSSIENGKLILFIWNIIKKIRIMRQQPLRRRYYDLLPAFRSIQFIRGCMYFNYQIIVTPCACP